MSSSTAHDSEGRLTEGFVQDAFHSYLRSSLSQAKAERLLDVEILSSAEADLMIAGPALCLYFAALRCTTNPPSVPLPRRDKSVPRRDLSLDNCPAPFISFLTIWVQCVPAIQSLAPEHQHDLARLICGLPPATQPLKPSLGRLAADLRAVAIEISQRRSFQDRYSDDLQAAFNTGTSGEAVNVKFEPPPAYTPSPTGSDFGAKLTTPKPPRTPSTLSPPSSAKLPGTSSPKPPASPSSPRSPSIAAPGISPAIELFRETLYAALADVLSDTPSLGLLLKKDPPRAYFGAVAFAILEVATTAVTPDGAVRGVRGTLLTLDQCPESLRPLMREFAAIGRHAHEVEEEDTQEAIRLAARGKTSHAPRLERVRAMLERGAGAESDNAAARRSEEGRALAFANRINALALSMTGLPQFRARQEEVFKVLSGVT